MPSATASGADASGSARSRDHNQGNQGRTYTVDQKAAVLRIRRCNATAFYDILGLETVKTTCTDSEIKKAYRKQSLLTHPDKNGHENADEAFKMVSRAFGVLGDKEKREKFDRYGTDPDSRFASQQAQNPFSGFASRQPSGGMGGRGGGMWGEEDVSPEEMFARFFGGGGGGGCGGPFGGKNPWDNMREPELTVWLTQDRNLFSTLEAARGSGCISSAAHDHVDVQQRHGRDNKRKASACRRSLACSRFYSSLSSRFSRQYSLATERDREPRLT